MSTRTLLASLLLAPSFVVLAAAPGHAAACPRGTGLTIVVEGASGGTRCAPAGGTAWRASESVGHALTPVTRSPGAVCRVNGFPATADEKCVVMPPTDAYWGLFHADGTGGGWTYAQLGAASLTLPSGSWVAWVFQDSNSRKSPRTTPLGPAAAAPRPAAPAPTRTQAGSAAKLAPAPTTPTRSPSARAGTAPSPSPSARASEPASAEPSAEASAGHESAEAVSPANAEAVASEGGSPLGLVLGGLLVVALAAAAVVLARRNR